MELSSLAGNPRLKAQLSQREEGRGLSHAYLIAGPAGSGRHTLARLLAGAMVCTAQPGLRPCGRCGPCKKVTAAIHPDVITVTGPEAGKPINVNQIRELQKDAHIRPNEGERKVYLLEQADRMRDEAQNAMLKLLEEGPKYAAFLLLCENAGGMLQTVRSRCEELPLTPVSPADCRNWLVARYPQRSVRELEQAALDCQGILGRAVEQLEGTARGADERRALAVRMADALEQGGEAELLEAAMAMDKLSREEVVLLLDAFEEELAGRVAASSHRRPLMRGVELTNTLRGAARLNVGGGQLAGWLCAGVFAAEP